MSGLPTVSVLMAAYNGEAFIAETVESVLSQTLGDFELVIVDDASTDNTAGVLDRFDDPRVVRIRNETNLYLHPAINVGLAKCQGEFVARIDHDDIAEPTRLEKQIAYLREHPKFAGCATWTTEIDENGVETGQFEVPGNPDYVRWAMTIKSVLYHPTLMFRRDVLVESNAYGLPVANSPADDYEMLVHLLMAGHDFGVVEERLLKYRRFDGNMSSTRADDQWDFGNRFSRQYVAWLLGEEADSIELESVAAMRELLMWSPPPPARFDHAVDLALRVSEVCMERADATAKLLIADEFAGHLKRRGEALLGSKPEQSTVASWALGQVPGHHREGKRLARRAAVERVKRRLKRLIGK